VIGKVAAFGMFLFVSVGAATAAPPVRAPAERVSGHWVLLAAPAGFRPRDTPERLVGLLAATNPNGYFHPQLEARYSKTGGDAVALDLDLLHSKVSYERGAAAQVLWFARTYGFSASCDLPAGPARARVERLLAAHGLDLSKDAGDRP
jgi:hypothetical protein